MFSRFEKRSYKLERLDTGDYTREEYELWLKEAKWINRWLGDLRALRLSLRDEFKDDGQSRISVLDVGAGSGELLKAAGDVVGARASLLVGAELNGEAARSMAKRKAEFGVLAVQCDALQLPFADNSFDFVISSLFLHHLDDQQALDLVKEMGRVARKRFFIIDLHRHPAAYYLYKTLGPLILQRFTIEDGSLSILRSFQPDELRNLSKTAGISDTVVKRRWAFRLVLSGSLNDGDTL
jgi:ubiquinone/menaquinone biosynthesis C-methylase UbiE